MDKTLFQDNLIVNYINGIICTNVKSTNQELLFLLKQSAAPLLVQYY